ncbi:hypothetical protein G7085_00820 [Tessaracoccus sp. HDW20]|nr:hypothetical protein [Tessaracoccus coleopterorum]
MEPDGFSGFFAAAAAAASRAALSAAAFFAASIRAWMRCSTLWFSASSSR